MFSSRYRQLLRGIELADTVTLDAHKQLYAPMGVGVLLCRTSSMLKDIEQQADYIVRVGSRDQGKFSLEGSRPGMALLVHSALRVFGRKGFELLIDYGIEQAARFAALINAHPDFELVTPPQLNVLTYRFHPGQLGARGTAVHTKRLNHLNIALQRRQRRRGVSFVSRTTLHPSAYPRPIVVLRVVLANPLTTMSHLKEILAEQTEIGHELLAEMVSPAMKADIQAAAMAL